MQWVVLVCEHEDGWVVLVCEHDEDAMGSVSVSTVNLMRAALNLRVKSCIHVAVHSKWVRYTCVYTRAKNWYSA